MSTGCLLYYSLCFSKEFFKISIKTYILDLNLPIAKIWHRGTTISEESKHWGVGKAQEEEAKPRAWEEPLGALRNLAQKPLTLPACLSKEPPGRGPRSSLHDPGSRARTRLRERNWDSISPSFLAMLPEWVIHSPTSPLLSSLPSFLKSFAPDQLHNLWGLMQHENVGLIQGLVPRWFLIPQGKPQAGGASRSGHWVHSFAHTCIHSSIHSNEYLALW